MKTNHFKMLLNVFNITYTYSNCIISIILLLKNNLTNICSKKSKIGMNLWMVYTCNMKSSGKYKRWEEGEWTLHRWTKSWEVSGCIRLHHFRNFKDIQLIVEYNIETEENLSTEKEKSCYSKWKKGKLKTKKLLKITILDEQEPSGQWVGRTKAVQV